MLLHFSDLHAHGTIASGGISVYRARLLEMALIRLSVLRDYIDAVLLSGDLADSGERKDLEAAYELLTAKPEQHYPWRTADGRLTLAGLPPVLIVPGNHDRYRNRLADGAGDSTFDRVFAEQWSGQSGLARTYNVVNKNGDTLVVIAGDACLESSGDATWPFGRWGQGKVSSRLIEQMKQLTRQARVSHPEAGVVWMVHFPPGFPHDSNSLKLLDDHLLVAGAEEVSVRHIFSGHTHHRLHYRAAVGADLQAGPAIHCAGTLGKADPGHTSFHLHRIKVDPAQDGGIPTVRVLQRDFVWDNMRPGYIEQPPIEVRRLQKVGEVTIGPLK